VFDCDQDFSYDDVLALVPFVPPPTTEQEVDTRVESELELKNGIIKPNVPNPYRRLEVQKSIKQFPRKLENRGKQSHRKHC